MDYKVDTKYVPSEEDYEKIDNIFTFHKAGEDQPVRYEAIRDKAKELAHLMYQLSPKSRELSLAITALQDSVMWANAAIAINEKLGEE